MEIEPGYQKKEIGIIPDDWDTKKVHDFGEVKRGAGSQYIEYVDFNGIRLIRINDFFEDNPVFVKPTDSIMRFKLTERDVLFAGTGASAGASFIPPRKWIGLPYSYNAPRIRLNRKESKEYLIYSLKSDYVSVQMKSLFVGAAQPFLDINAISNLIIAVPKSIIEQKAIAEVLSDTDELIQMLEKQIAKKRLIKQGAMKELLTPKDDWEVKKLCDFDFDISDGNYSSKYPKSSEFIQSGVPFIRANNIKRSTVVEKDMRYISKELHSGLQKGHLKKDDILITTRGEIGQIAIVPNKYIDANINAQVVRINTNNKLNKKYFAYFLLRSEIQSILLNFQTGSALKQLPVGKLIELQIIYPSIEEQTRITTILSDMDKEIEILENKLAIYKKLKQGMMQELLTGKTRLV